LFGDVYAVLADFKGDRLAAFTTISVDLYGSASGCDCGGRLAVGPTTMGMGVDFAISCSARTKQFPLA
jgi:hypothetical protein